MQKKVIKTDLALIDEIEKAAIEVKKVTNEFEKTINDYEQFISRMKSAIDGKTQQSITLRTKIDDAKIMAKQLGVSFNDSKYAKILEEYYKIVDRYDRILK
jgi:hypothetical protein